MQFFSTSLNQVLLMITFIIVGCLLAKTGKIVHTASKALSSLLVYICLPAVSFSTCYNNVTVENLLTQWKIIFSGAIILAVGYVVSIVLAKAFAKDDFEKNIYSYSFTIPNISYMGYPVVGAVFGDKTLFQMMMFVLPMLIFIYTKGINMLTPDKKTGFKKVILQPIFIAMILGTVFGLSGIKLPGLVSDIVETASGSMAFVAMIMTGCVISGKPIKELVTNKKAYFASVIRLIVLPLIALAVLILIKADKDIMIVAVATLAMPLGLNTVVFPEAYGGDGRPGARLAFISHTLSIITIPVVFGILSLFV